MANTSFSGPVNSAGGFVGNLTGNVTGSVTGATAAEVVTATNVITAAESGTTFFLSSATEFVSTLPAPALGLNFTFIVAAAPASASYTTMLFADGIHLTPAGNRWVASYLYNATAQGWR